MMKKYILAGLLLLPLSSFAEAKPIQLSLFDPVQMVKKRRCHRS